MGIGAHPAAVMADQKKIAIARQFIAGIGDDAVLSSAQRRTTRHREIDAVIVKTAFLGAETR